MAHMPLQNISEKLQQYQSIAPKPVMQAIQKASAKTGVDFAYLMEKAASESAFDAGAKAKTSSATGLYQFIDKTWLSMIKQHGAKYGLEKYAENADNPKMRHEILSLRKDPEISALMAAEFTKDNQNYLEDKLGRKANATDLYMAHFLGAGGAAKFLTSLENAPDKEADDLLPKAAKANKPVFYDRTDGGKARSVKDVYAMFAQKFGDTVKIQNAPSILEEQPITLAENTLPATPETENTATEHYGSIPLSRAMPSAQQLSSATVFAMADIGSAFNKSDMESALIKSEMQSVLYDLSTERYDDHNREDEDDSFHFPTPGFA